MSAHKTALAELETARRIIEELKTDAEAAESVAAQFPALNATVSISTTCRCVWVTVLVDSLAEVRPLLAEIVRAGYRPKGRTDYLEEHSPRVTYDYGHDGPDLICVNVRIKSQSTTCRLEKIGEKTVPILKLVCA